jgi:OOP family OmpA-OmpF porin
LDRDDPCPEAAGELPGGCPEKVCPVLDADGDGLLNEVDQCPNEAARTLTGCIVHDKDNDGIPDDRDKCVEEQETRNGFEDTDGCPDEIPEKVRKFTGVIKGIEFDLGSSKIKKQSERLLGEAAGVLKGYPELRVQITGHSDDQGERETNMKLSQERADSVKAFLVQLGVADNQIETKGMGPDRPLTENDTAAGRQKNRRIEFAIIND